MQVIATSVASGIAGAIALAVAAAAWRYRDASGGGALVAFNVGVAVWTIGNAFQTAATTLSGKLLWVNVQYVGIALIPVSTYAFACRYTGHEELATPRRIALVALPLVVLTVLSWTNGFHGLVRASETLTTEAGTVRFVREFGPAFWFGWLYSGLVNVSSATLLLYWLLRHHRTYLRQAVVVGAGVTVPWLAHLLFVAGELRTDPEAAFAVTGIAFFYAVRRSGLLSLVPVARAHVFETIDDAVVVVDDGRIVDANPAAGRLLDVDPDDVVGTDVETAFEGHPDLRRAAETSGDGEVISLASAEGEGETRYLDLRRSALEGRGEVLVFRDVTEQIRRERRLEAQTERLKGVGDTIAHDLRNPLAVANGYLDLAMAEADEDVLTHLRRVEDAHGRMDHIIDDVLAAARAGESLSTRRVSLERLARDAWSSVDTGDASLVVETGPREIEADPDQLRRALENLFRNSVEHGSTSSRTQSVDSVEHGSTDSDGAITVRVGVTDGGFFVADDGIGIPESERNQVLEYGYTEYDTGTGLGLAIVQDIAEGHGWSLTVTESDDGGARFEFEGVDVPTDRSPTTGTV